MPKKTSSRALYTKNRLIDVMFQLLETNNFYQITVNSICKEAAISRTTFYLHYEDKYELTCSCIESIVSGLYDDENIEEAVTKMVYATHDRKKALRSLIALDGDAELQPRIDAMFLNIYLKYFQKQERQGVKFKIPIELLARYHCSGATGLMLWWVNSDNPISRDTMVSYLLRQ